jgi:hypothetical protein
VDHGSGTHGAGFKGHEYFAVCQAVVAYGSGCLTQGYDFGVGRWVQVTEDSVLSSTYNYAVFDHDGPYWDFACTRGGARFL